MNRLAVVALGGNALIRNNEEGTIEQQEQNATDTLENLVHLIHDDYELVITHGNGPQVGNILLRNEAGKKLHNVAPMPLDICVADSQGGIGYMIERILRNVFKKHGIGKNIITLITLTVINPNDTAFKNPLKRIGKPYNKQWADILTYQKNWIFKPSTKVKNKYYRVVPSPAPIDIINKRIIEQLVRAENVVIAAGGGGIPVYYDDEGILRTIDAVIDKDMASSLLATGIGAEELFILTDVPFIYKDYRLPTQEKLEFLNYSDARSYLENGTFAEGTMEPKIKACLEFIKNGGKKGVITEAKNWRINLLAPK